MSFWYGPYVIVEKHTDLTYKIKKENSEKTLIVHLDRLRPYCTQVLSYETETYNSDLEKENVENDAEEPREESLVMLGNSELNEIELDYSGRRQRRRPAWHSEYEVDYTV